MLRMIQNKFWNRFYLGRRGETAVQMQAVRTAYQRFQVEQPQWANSLFDDWFLRREAAVLFANDTLPSPQQLAIAWRNQFGVGSVAQKRADICHMVPVTRTFLAMIQWEIEKVTSSVKSVATGTATSL